LTLEQRIVNLLYIVQNTVQEKRRCMDEHEVVWPRGGLYLTGQRDILATAIPGFPVWDLGGLLGSTLWGLWVIALGVAVLRGPTRRPVGDPVTATAPATPRADPA
jgi:hypothetical protein